MTPPGAQPLAVPAALEPPLVAPDGDGQPGSGVGLVLGVVEPGGVVGHDGLEDVDPGVVPDGDDEPGDVPDDVPEDEPDDVPDDVPEDEPDYDPTVGE